jgi:hypothetical protein
MIKEKRVILAAPVLRAGSDDPCTSNGIVMEENIVANNFWPVKKAAIPIDGRSC